MRTKAFGLISRASTSAIPWSSVYLLTSLPFATVSSGKTLQASLSKEGLHTTPVPWHLYIHWLSADNTTAYDRNSRAIFQRTP